MAKKRMFSLQIVDTDAFLDMPLSSQNLYFHLCMRADDDGFVSSPKKIMKVVNCNDDDMKVLLTKRFLLRFESGIIVIKHWKIHNYIAKDRYKETLYIEEKEQLIEKENGCYTECIQDDAQMLTQSSIGKVRLDKDNKIAYVKESTNHFGSLDNVGLTIQEHWRLLKEYGEETATTYIERLSLYIPNKQGKPYKDHNAVIRSWLNKDGVNKVVTSKPLKEVKHEPMEFLK